MKILYGFGRRIPGWWLIALSLVTLMPWQEARSATPETSVGSIYEVRHVEISIPLGGKSVEVMHEAGVAQAQREGLQRLFKRMLTAQEREARKEWIAAQLKEAKRLTERAVVRSKKQVGERLDMTVDLVFSRKEVSAALVKESIPHGESPYPLVLLIAREETPPGAATFLWQAMPNAARDLGVSLLQPMGDMEDLTQLSWDKASRGDPGVLNWTASRYGASATWVVQAEYAPLTPGKGGAARGRVSGTLIVSRADSAPVTFQAREEKSAATPEEVSGLLYPVVARRKVPPPPKR
ncbi:MAG: DUF2066 domain-containing protein [Magnetococcales bacterium]|nr:DUF2066 domain-containing protein [Magnetococcales bacterium]